MIDYVQEKKQCRGKVAETPLHFILMIVDHRIHACSHYIVRCLHSLHRVRPDRDPKH